MDLLETVLRASKAEQFIKTFRSASIDACTLKILKDEDLKLLGVQDEETRKSILSHVENLRIPSENNVELVFDEEYAEIVLEQLKIQLNRHIANLTIANLREDVQLCDVKLAPAVKCLENQIITLEQTINNFEDMIIMTKKKRRRTKNILFPTIIATALMFFVCRKYILFSK